MAAYTADQFFDGADRDAVRAIESGDDDAVARARVKGADLDRPGRQGVPPLLYFIANNDTASLTRLLKLGARFDTRLPRSLGPAFPESFAWVVANTDTTMLSALLSSGLDANMRLSGDATLLFWTVNPFNRAAFDLLIRHGAQINAQSNSGRTVLHDAIQQQNYRLAEFLMVKGADPTIRNVRGLSAIDLLDRHAQRAQPGSPIAQEIQTLRARLRLPGG